MFNLKTIFRRLRSNRLVTIFNLLGFVLCFFAITLIGSYVYSEVTTDNYHKNKERIFALSPYSDGTWVQYVLINLMNDNSVFNKVIPYGFDWNKSYLKYQDNQAMESQTIFVDSAFFEAFSFEFIAGDPKECVSVPYSAVITQSEARRFFGNENPIGQKLKYNSKYELTVTGVINDYPGNSIFRSKCFVSFSTLKIIQPYTFSCGWDCSNLKAFVMLRSNEYKASAITELRNILTKHDGGDNGINPALISLHDFYFDKRFEVPQQMNKGDMASVVIFLSLGILIFVIALFNYFNLSVASLIEKRKEAAILKIFGNSFRHQWMLLFSEAFILSAVAWLIALALQKIFISTSLGSSLALSEHLSSDLMAGLIPLAATLMLALFAGFAGAVYIRKRPVQDAYQSVQDSGKNSFQLLMLMAQFCIVTFLIGATLTTRKQVSFMQNSDPGFSKENLICVESSFDLKGEEEVLKRDFLSIPGVINVTFSDAIPGIQTQNWGTEITVDGEAKNITLAAVPVRSDFLHTYNFKLKEGRLFSDSLSTDYGNVVINEAAVKITGWKDPIGQTLYDWTINNRKLGGKIVGIIKDNHFQSMHERIEPMAFINLKGYSKYTTLKVIGGLDNQKRILAQAKEKWQKLEPDFPFRYFYFDQYLDQEYRKEAEIGKLTLLLSIISIIITGLGLIGVSLFIARKKTKEIGIRRVNGATTSEIIGWLNSRFYLSLMVAVMLALPLLWWFMNRWLQTFAYKTTMPWWVFAISAIVTVAVAMLCLIWQSWQAATRNPVEALRHE
jgi:putative ABC transport system permease protein